MAHKHFWTAMIACTMGLASLFSPITACAEENASKGDVNQDGVFNVADVILLQKWLLAVPDTHLEDWKAADFCEDNRLDVFDLCLMKRELLKNGIRIEYDVAAEQYFNGYTDEIYKTASWSSENFRSDAVVTSVSEMENYLSAFFDSSIIQYYKEIYDESYFSRNVLLLNSLHQSSGATLQLSVTDVKYIDQQIKVNAKWSIPECREDVESAVLCQISISKDSYHECPVVWEISEEFVPDTPVIEPPEPTSTFKLIAMRNILQNPELPTGCESVSLTILLNHLGFSVDKMTIARNYLPKLNFYWSGGVYYGADFRTTFAGDPESSSSYGCYAPCITTTANKYFSSNGYDAKATNVTGTAFDSLLTDYIDNDIPVLIWITSNNLHETKLTSVWTTPAGEKVQWVAYEHCVVLTGYDKDKGIIYVSDPLVGNTSYDYSRIKQRYLDLGQQAVYIDTN